MTDPLVGRKFIPGDGKRRGKVCVVVNTYQDFIFFQPAGRGNFSRSRMSRSEAERLCDAYANAK